MRGIIAPSQEGDRAVRFLTKYLTTAVAEPITAADGEDLMADVVREVHVDRLQAELRFLPLLARVCELVALRRPTPRSRPRDATRVVQLQSP